ncbi:MAG TPA: hypothetical protein VIH86_09395 [Puia sp.]
MELPFINLPLNGSTTDERIATCLPEGRHKNDAMKTDAGIKKVKAKSKKLKTQN